MYIHVHYQLTVTTMKGLLINNILLEILTGHYSRNTEALVQCTVKHSIFPAPLKFFPIESFHFHF